MTNEEMLAIDIIVMIAVRQKLNINRLKQSRKMIKCNRTFDK